MKKLAIASFAVLILGSTAALAQPYGYGDRYGDRYQQTRSCQNPDRAYDAEQFRRGHMENIINCIGDPATGMHITQQQYLNKYPWSDVRTWVYNPSLDVWADNTPDRDRLYSGDTRDNSRYSRNYSPDYRYRR